MCRGIARICAEFHTRALETVQGLSGRRTGKYDAKVLRESPRNFFGKSSVLGVLRAQDLV